MAWSPVVSETLFARGFSGRRVIAYGKTSVALVLVSACSANDLPADDPTWHHVLWLQDRENVCNFGEVDTQGGAVANHGRCIALVICFLFT